MSVLYEDPKKRGTLFDDSVDYDEEEDGENAYDKTDEPYWIKAPTDPTEAGKRHWSEGSPPSSSNQNESGDRGVRKGEEAEKMAELEGWTGKGMWCMAWICGGVGGVIVSPFMLLVYRLMNANWLFLEKDILSTGISIFSLTLERELIAIPVMIAIAFSALKCQKWWKGLPGKYRVQHEQLGDCEVLGLLPVLGFLTFGTTIGTISANVYLGTAWVRLIDLSLPLVTVYLGHMVGMETMGLFKIIALVTATGGAVLTLIFFNLGSGSDGGSSPDSTGPWQSSMWWAGLLIMIPSLLCNSFLLIGMGVVLRGQKRTGSTAWMDKTQRGSLLSKLSRVPSVLTCVTYFQGTVYTLVCCTIFHKNLWKDFRLHGEFSPWLELLYGSIFVSSFGWNTITWTVNQVGPAMVAASVCMEPFAGSLLGQLHIKGSHMSTLEWIGGLATFSALGVLCAIYYFEERATRRVIDGQLDFRKPLIQDIEKNSSEDEFIFGE